MNSRKNPSVVRAFSALSLTLVFAGSGCSTLFQRGEKNDANHPENNYSASEDDAGKDETHANSPDPKLKDQKIQSLENTVISLNTRIQDLEGRLQASQNRPNLSSSDRQLPDGSKKSSGLAFHATVAANDPGAGFVNDANVRAFQQGKLLFDQDKYPEAILAFSAFLERNANHPLASSAQYYIGESYLLQNDFSVADQEYQKLAVRYPQSSRVSFALVRLAQTSEKLGKTEEARRYRIQAEGLFAKSPALLMKGSSASSAREASASAPPPIATAPISEGLTVEKPTMDRVETPTVESPHVEPAHVEAPKVESPIVEAPKVAAPHVEMSTDLDAPPSGTGG